MKNINIIPSILIICLLAIPTLQLNDSTPKEILHQIHQEIQQHQIELDHRQQELNSWVAQELKEFQAEDGEVLMMESFSFELDSKSSIVLKWDPSREKELKISVAVLEVINNQINLAKGEEEHQYIEIDIRNENKKTYNNLGHVYVEKIFKVNFDTDYKYIRFTNLYPSLKMLMVDIEKLDVIASGNIIKDESLAVGNKKVLAIMAETSSGQKMREHTYKYEWGFLENQYLHESRLLGLTGIELFIILGTACLQMFFLKGLLDNRAIV